jgi:5-methylcytosine-specific restriction enzyme A
MPRAPKGCAKPGCREKQPCPTHRPAWKRSSGQRELTPEFHVNARRIRAEKPACRACGRVGRVEIDHIIPRSRGGTDKRENLQPLCPKCHSEKTKREKGN